jgi:L-methionine (R)-S-oxide reductase
MKKNYYEALKQIETLAAKIEKTELFKKTVEILKGSIAHYNWVGIYILEGDELVLGPYLGKPSPHTRIKLNQGICGAAASQKETVIVPDVGADPRYLACSLDTKSETVVPIMRGRRVFGEIDIDSDKPNAFGTDDQHLLERIAEILAKKF